MYLNTEILTPIKNCWKQGNFKSLFHNNCLFFSGIFSSVWLKTFTCIKLSLHFVLFNYSENFSLSPKEKFAHFIALIDLIPETTVYPLSRTRYLVHYASVFFTMCPVFKFISFINWNIVSKINVVSNPAEK